MARGGKPQTVDPIRRGSKEDTDRLLLFLANQPRREPMSKEESDRLCEWLAAKHKRNALQTPTDSGQSDSKKDVSDAVDEEANAVQTPTDSGQGNSKQDVSDAIDEVIPRRSRRPRISTSLVSAKGASTPPAKRASRKSAAKTDTVADLDGASTQQSLTERQQIRHNIATGTALKKDKFLQAHKSLFLPLLPKDNYIQKLVAQAAAGNADHQIVGDDVYPYEAISVQPKGVTAIMKPYQLGGLSFLVWLHRNGVSGILGDEMGLGKTLQTLSFCQYLKEQTATLGEGDHKGPFLIVCPLSVLSSWMAECRKWTPDLKVIRFHGPSQERARLKRVVEGKEDMHGSETFLAKRIKNTKTSGGRHASKSKTDMTVGTQSKSGGTDEGEVDLVITTYETFQAEQIWFKRVFVWKYVVLDEGHKIKNNMSMISTSLQGLKAEYRLILTGTPLQNDLTELWALLRWLYPEVFPPKTSEIFRDSFDLSQGNINISVMDDARRLLELVMLRRMKISPGVDLNLPPKREVFLFVPLTPLQRSWYTRLLTKVDRGLLNELFQGAKDKEEKIMEQEKSDLQGRDANGTTSETPLGSNGIGHDQALEDGTKLMRQAIDQEKGSPASKSAWQKLMNLLMQLRKCCNHPYLLSSAMPDPYYLGDHIIHASGKFIVLQKLVTELVINQGKKILIFSGFTSMLDCCEDLLSLLGGNGAKFRYRRLDGGTGRAKRNLSIRLFNQNNSDYQVMLISTKAGGLGINLTSATEVVILDQDWNPQITSQAEDRAHRIGQTKEVTIYKFCTQGTVEVQMLRRVDKKKYLSAKVTESMRDMHATPAKGRAKKGSNAMVDDDAPQMGKSELLSLVRRGAQPMTCPDIDLKEMLEWDWPTTLEKCKESLEDSAQLETSADKANLDEDREKEWLSKMERVESYVFDGKKYDKVKTKKASADVLGEETRREDRRIGKNTTVVVDGYEVTKESTLCKDWEAVPTMAGKDPRLAEVKRAKKTAVVNQAHCQICWDGGKMFLCSGCPRSYHIGCLDDDAKRRCEKKVSQFYCNQHQCHDCGEKTTNAGGLLYRCRWCDHSYCEDCLDFDKAKLVGDNLKEYEMLGFPEVDQAFYIECPVCVDHYAKNRPAKEYCEGIKAEIDQEYGRWQNRHMVETDGPGKSERPSTAVSLTDATTLMDESGISTPVKLPLVGPQVAMPKASGSLLKRQEIFDLDSDGVSSKRARLL